MTRSTIVLRPVSFALFALLATLAVAARARAEPFSVLRVSLGTGDDDKREDTSVVLRLDTTDGPRTFTLSPGGERLADRTTATRWFFVGPSVESTHVTGCALVVDLGEGDGLFRHRDNWWMTGLKVEAVGSGWITLFDPAGWRHKFEADETLPCPPPIPAISGTYVGPIFGDAGLSASLTTTFSGTAASITGAASIASGLIFNCFGDHPVGAASFTLTGSRSSIDPDGTSWYHLTGTVSAAGQSIGISVDGHLYNGSLWFDGNAHLSGPAGCNKDWVFQLDRR
jgi:hypothetical protein